MTLLTYLITFLLILVRPQRRESLGEVIAPYSTLWVTYTQDQFLSYFFVKKIPLSRRVEYVMGRG